MFSLTELEDFDFRIAEEKDVNHIVDILHAAARVDASQEERSSQGFVQGRMGKEGIEQWILADSPVRGAVVAHNKMDDSIIGVCFFSPVPTEIAGPPVVQGIAQAVADSADIDAAKALAYGPLAVRDVFSGRGLAKHMIAFIAGVARDHEKTHIVASVEDANQKSLGMHEHLGAERIGSFEREGRPYSVVAFETVA
ncbi:GNAT family N-acetyltransferase [Rothia terrae]|uniref:GNAT family N-acetyltransferase n=1 Tax=Rothia terrae TaxID=396015 RepID=A0A7H2BG34_9MICC|nr:GNAT family N-acetyltransferase [Rothia terrae]QNV38630.1 GNAT family N-acetyltransferase [Rothia terrae]